MKLLENKKILYDGLENQELYTKTFDVKNNNFKLSKILINKIEHLKKQIPKEDFLEIVKELEFQTIVNSDFVKYFKDLNLVEELYQSKDGLSIYYIIKENQLYIFSFGEKQPGRYILYLEAGYFIN